MIVVIVGAQYGGEGKGKLTSLLAPSATLVVRAGGPNSGHTFEGRNGRMQKVRMLPSAPASPGVHLAIGAGAVIDVDVLLGEIHAFDITATRLTIDPRAFTIRASDSLAESRLRQEIASTATGTGAAAARRILGRLTSETPSRAGDDPRLRPFLGDVGALVASRDQQGEVIVVEGTQGFGLSLYHGEYPFVTSRDTTASAVCSEIGIPPSAVSHVVMAARTFPIRVGGPSGPLANEISWQEVTRLSQSPTPIQEFTTVTNTIRRVGRFDPALVQAAVRVNRPSVLALMHVDYLDAACRGCCDFESLSNKAKQTIAELESSIGGSFGILSTGPERDSTILRTDQLPNTLRALFTRSAGPA